MVKQNPIKRVTATDYDSDIDPDDLLPLYLECKTKLFNLQTSKSKGGQQVSARPNGRNAASNSQHGRPITDPEAAKILGKIKRIEDDVLFDPYLAGQQWEARRIQLEKEAAVRRHAVELSSNIGDQQSETLVDTGNEVSPEAAVIGAALLEEEDNDDDAALTDLFAGLPVNEVDPVTGKSSTVINGSNGTKVRIRDFGKWTGVNPTRVLEEACRAR